MTLAGSDPTPKFILGIAALAATLDPGDVGEPLENERYYIFVDGGGSGQKAAIQFTEGGVFVHCFWLNRTYFFKDESLAGTDG